MIKFDRTNSAMESMEGRNAGISLIQPLSLILDMFKDLEQAGYPIEELSCSDDEIKEFTDKYTKLARRIDDIVFEHGDMLNKCADSEKEKLVKRSKILEKDIEFCKQIEGKISEQAEQNKKLDEQIQFYNSRKTELEEKNAEFGKLQEKLEELKEVCRRYESADSSSIEQLNSEIEFYKGKNNRLNEEQLTLQENLNQLKNDYIATEKKICDLNSEIDKKTRDINQLDEDYNQYSDKLESIKKQKTSKMNAKNEKMSEIAMLKSEIDIINADMPDENKLSELSNRLKSLTALKESRFEENENLAKDIEKTEKEFELLSKDFDKLSGEKDSLMNKMSEVKGKIEEVRSQIETLKSDTKKKQEELDDAESEYAAVAKSMNYPEIESKVNVLKAKLSELKKAAGRMSITVNNDPKAHQASIPSIRELMKCLQQFENDFDRFVRNYDKACEIIKEEYEK